MGGQLAAVNLEASGESSALNRGLALENLSIMSPPTEPEVAPEQRLGARQESHLRELTRSDVQPLSILLEWRQT